MPGVFEIETNVERIVEEHRENGVTLDFIYDFILAYGLPRASVTRLKKGDHNLSKRPGEICWKGKLLYKQLFKGELNVSMALETAKSIKHAERFVVLTDGDELLCVDTKTKDTLQTLLKDLPKHYAFFLPWAGIEKTEFVDENPADVRAARKMAKLFDEIRKDNLQSQVSQHDLNVFLSRLLFCFFAEDTGIFAENLFVNTIAKTTVADGSDLKDFFERLFFLLDTPMESRKSLPDYLEKFPYVNGGLFRAKIDIPTFSAHSRNKIIECGELDWKDINPDIFGSMFQTVIDEEQRSNLGQHYTSVPNIMKVIEPLFLNELREEFEAAGKNEFRLKKLLNRIRNIRVFDPACGSGNFLIIAYKELRSLEMDILLKLQEFGFTGIHLDHFYGIEIDDFACETAKLSLWLAEHQMNVEYYSKLGTANPTLPLKEAGRIVLGNACRLDWNEVCPKNDDEEIYVLGNPPYLGGSKLNGNQKEDREFVLNEVKGFKNLDYIACWFYKGAKYIYGSQARLSFVSTNSICQGEQVAILWPKIFSLNLEIFFSYDSFKWTNNAAFNAGVAVTIIGLRKKSDVPKYHYHETKKQVVKNQNAYLLDYKDITIKKKNSPLTAFIPVMRYGSKAVDDGNLCVSEKEKKDIEERYPELRPYIKQYVGAEEFIKGLSRYCFWIEDEEYDKVKDNPEIKRRVELCRMMRLKSKKNATKKLAEIPYKFGEIRYKKANSILVPETSSEKRMYIPIEFFSVDAIISNAAFAIYGAESWIFSVLNSKMHMVWARTVGGTLEERIRYSVALVYNTFPFPLINDDQKNILKHHAFAIIGARENHPGKTLAKLYNPESMPEDLKRAHEENDLAIEKMYRAKPFASDEERLEFLFKLYEQMISEEGNKNTFFAKQNKTRKR